MDIGVGIGVSVGGDVDDVGAGGDSGSVTSGGGFGGYLI